MAALSPLRINVSMAASEKLAAPYPLVSTTMGMSVISRFSSYLLLQLMSMICEMTPFHITIPSEVVPTSCTEEPMM